MIQLGSEFHLESSERSDPANWIKRDLLRSGIRLEKFEGYTIKNNRVSLLLDRISFSGAVRDFSDSEIEGIIRSVEGRSLNEKVAFCKYLDVPWLYVLYCYGTRRVFIIDHLHQPVRLLESFDSFELFGKWTFVYRDLRMFSRYEEAGLPEFDRTLRAAGTPWPGNLDDVLIVDGRCIAIIEFQKTRRATVRGHCNNTWFRPRGGRKGDKQRWFVLDIIARQSRCPLWIIVWSEAEKEVKWKQVDEILFEDTRAKRQGLYYRSKVVLSSSELIDKIRGYVRD